MIDTRWFIDRIADQRLSQRKLAKLIGIDPGAMSLMLRGKRRMTLKEAGEIARLLGVEASEVLVRAGGNSTMQSARNGGRESVSGQQMDGNLNGQPGDGLAVSTYLDARTSVSPSVAGTVQIPVPLASGGIAVLTLPPGLTVQDAERLAVIVRAYVVS